MLSEFDDIVSRASGPGREHLDEDLRLAARALLDRQYIYGDDFQMKRRYELLVRHKSYFIGLFDALGFTFAVDDREQFVGIVSQSGAVVRPMVLDETCFLVGLRVVYEQRIKEFLLADGGRAETSLSEVWSIIEERTKRPRPGPGRCRALVDAYQRNGLVKALDARLDGDMGIEIRPAIARAVTTATVESLEMWAQSHSRVPTAPGSRGGEVDPDEIHDPGGEPEEEEDVFDSGGRTIARFGEDDGAPDPIEELLGTREGRIR